MRYCLYNLATDKSKGMAASLAKVFLFMLSLIYAVILKSLILFFQLRPHRFNCKVISVGNITLGGTGKTTLVELIAGYLKQQGRNVAILTRGYKKTGSGQDNRNLGDEPCMLAANLKDVPVVVDADRVRAGKKAISAYGTDTLILDDGFQQWRIKKDLEIVTIDSTNPFGNFCLIPRGILREPLSSLLRADVFVLTKTNPGVSTDYARGILGRFNPTAPVIESTHTPLGFYNLGTPEELLEPAGLRGRGVTLFCGIADPLSFENLIVDYGIKIGLIFRFDDHHNYSVRELNKIIAASEQKGIDTLITTQKDAARLSELGLQNMICACGLRVLVLRITMSITKDEEEFYHRLLKLYRP